MRNRVKSSSTTMRSLDSKNMSGDKASFRINEQILSFSPQCIISS